MAWLVPLRLLAVVPLAVLFVHYGAEVVAVDGCLDSGGVYDYARAECRMDVEALPYVPYLARYRVLSTGLVATSLASSAILLLTRRRRWS